MPQALERLRAQGLDVIYSSRFVTEEQIVQELPPPGPPEERLRRLLEPFELAAKVGADGTWRIVPAPAAVLEGCVTSDPGHLPVVSATVQVEGRESRLTDPTGCFRLLGLPPGSTRLQVSRPGFISLQETVDLPSGAVHRQHFALRIDAETRDEIFVSTTPDEPPLGTVSLDGPASAHAVSDRDLSSRIAKLPGSRPEIGASFGVRGEDGDRVHLVVDGIEVAEPYHLRDLGRLAGAVTPAAVEDVRLHRGAPPIAFGHRAGGIVELTTASAFERLSGRAGLADEEVEIGLNGALGEGQGRWLAAYRLGYPEIPSDIVDLENHPSYSDAAVKFAVALTDHQELSARLFNVEDDFTYSSDATLAATDVPFSVLTASRRSKHVGLRHVSMPAERHLLSVDLVSTSMDNLRAGFEDSHIPLFPVRPKLFRLDDRRNLRSHELRGQSEAHLSSRWDLLSGVGLSRGETRYGYQGFGFGLPLPTHLDLDQQHVGAYSQGTFRPRRRLTVRLGIRLDDARSSRRLLDLDTGAIQQGPFGDPGSGETPCDDDDDCSGGSGPGTSMPGRDPFPGSENLSQPWDRRDRRWAPRLAVTFDSGAGIWRFEAARAYDFARGHELKPADGDWALPGVEASDHAALGFSRSLGAIRVGAELYHRRVRDPRPRYINLLKSVSRIPELELDRRRLDPETSRMQGLELRLDWQRGAFDGRLAYEWSRAEDRLDGVWTPRSTDRRHQLDLRFACRLNDHLQLALYGTAATGRPTTPFDLSRRQGEDLDPALGDYNSSRLPDDYRLDLRMRRNAALGPLQLAFEWGVDNVFDRRSVRGFDLSVLAGDEPVTVLPPELGLGRRFRWGLELSW